MGGRLEALRVYLEQKLGEKNFVTEYRYLISLGKDATKEDL
jgi:hypothetical protein